MQQMLSLQVTTYPRSLVKELDRLFVIHDLPEEEFASRVRELRLELLEKIHETFEDVLVKVS